MPWLLDNKKRRRKLTKSSKKSTRMTQELKLTLMSSSRSRSRRCLRFKPWMRSRHRRKSRKQRLLREIGDENLMSYLWRRIKTMKLRLRGYWKSMRSWQETSRSKRRWMLVRGSNTLTRWDLKLRFAPGWRPKSWGILLKASQSSKCLRNSSCSRWKISSWKKRIKLQKGRLLYRRKGRKRYKIAERPLRFL